MELTRFWVECPGCGDPKGSYSTTMIRAGRSCDCGTDFTINLETKEAERIDNDDLQRNGHR